MQARARLLGHPVHPILVAVPIGLFVISLLFDVIVFAGGSESLAVAAFWNILAGFCGGLFAAIFGFVDWLAIPARSRAKRIGAVHALGNVGLVGLFIVSFLLRIGTPNHGPTALALLLEVVAVLTLLLTGWLGGELVDRLGVGVDDGANVNAPSSLTRRHA